MHGAAWDESRDFDVLVIGDLNVDLILSGLPRLPQFGEEVLATGLAQRLGGSAANFAVCCARLGMSVAFVANVGRDEFGSFLRNTLEELGVATDYVRRHPDLSTGITVSLSGAHDRAFVTYVGTIDSLHGSDIPPDLPGRARHMHVASYFLQTQLRPDLLDLVARVHETGATVSLDTGFDPAERWDSGLLSLLSEMDIFLPNEVEAQAIAAAETVDSALATLCGMTKLVAVKVGAEGSLACDGRETIHVPAFRLEVADTTGCGDSFNAGFIDGLLQGLPLAESMARGNACGALMASVVGNDAHVLTPAAIAQLTGDEAQ